MKWFMFGALLALPLAFTIWVAVNECSQSNVSAWSLYRWVVLLPLLLWHKWLCGKSVARLLEAKQKSYLDDLKENHATLGHLFHVSKYAKYNLYRETDLRVSVRAYWGGLLVVVVLMAAAWYLPLWWCQAA